MKIKVACVAGKFVLSCLLIVCLLLIGLERSAQRTNHRDRPLGADETKRNLNSRRLQNVRAYWMHGVAPGAQRKSEMIILAEGERVSGNGRLEFYARGKLVWLLNIPRNADVDFGDC